MQEALTDYIKNVLNINVHHIDIIKRSESHYCVKAKPSVRMVPYLRIFVYESSFESVIRNPKDLGLAKQEIANKIIEFIGNIDESSFDKEDCFDPEMYIGVSSWDNHCYCDFAYNQKEEIEECISKILPVKPRGVYATSIPGINIVYETEDYEKNNIKEYEQSIKNAILQLADEFVLKKYGEKFDNIRFYIGIWNPDMKGYNGYGIVRQD